MDAKEECPMCSKRMFSLLVSGALLFTLTACGPKQAPPSSSSEPPRYVGAGSGGARPGARSPLLSIPSTGEGCAQDISQNRPVAIMLNNLKKDSAPRWRFPGGYHL